MDPVTLIVAALVAGAAAGAKDTATAAIKDAYAAFKSLVKKKFRGDSTATGAVEELEQDPDTWTLPLKKKVAAARLDQDQEIVDAARALIAGAEAAGVDVNKVISQVAIGDQNVQSADVGGNVTVTYGTPSTPKP